MKPPSSLGAAGDDSDARLLGDPRDSVHSTSVVGSSLRSELACSTSYAIRCQPCGTRRLALAACRRRVAGELLIDLEEDEPARLQLAKALRRHELR